MSAPFPWGDAMAFGLGVLRLPPPVFWAMTPRELGAAIRGVTGAAPPLMRHEFSALMARYPDNPGVRP